MINIQFIKSPEKRKIVKELEEQYGITELPYLFLQAGKDKIRGFSGHLSKDEIFSLAKLANIELIGLYLLKKEQDWRINFDALPLIKKQINKNIFPIDDQQFQKWIRGNDIEAQAQKGTLIIQYNKDFVGSGKSNGQVIFNYVPKERRIRK